jgi:prevent-host-death family protein
MKTMAAGKFKSECLRIMDEVRQSREPVLITKRGKPVAKLVPAGATKCDIFGCMVGEFEIVGDIVAPVLTANEVLQSEREWQELGL